MLQDSKQQWDSTALCSYIAKWVNWTNDYVHILLQIRIHFFVIFKVRWKNLKPPKYSFFSFHILSPTLWMPRSSRVVMLRLYHLYSFPERKTKQQTFDRTQKQRINQRALRVTHGYDDMMIINLYSTNSMWHVQMRFTISMHETEPKALKAPLAAAIRFMYDL